MRRHLARFSIYATLVGLVVAATFGAVIAADKFSVRAMMNTGKPAANLPVFVEIGGQQTPAGTTNASGDFELAMDSSKNGQEFGIYRETCNKLVIRARDPQREEECRKQSEQEKDKECKTCELVADMPTAGHGALLSPPPPMERLGEIAADLLSDPPGFDRSVLPAVDRKIAAFFTRHLLP